MNALVSSSTVGCPYSGALAERVDDSASPRLVEGHVAIEAPAGVPRWDIDPYENKILAALEGYYENLRAKGPFAYCEKYSILICGRYAETREVFSDAKRFVSSRGVGLTDFHFETPWRQPSIILEVDPPQHTKARAAMTRALSPKAVAELKQSFKDKADALVDALLDRQDIDGVLDFAEAFPTTVFPEAVGLAESDARKLIDYGAIVFNALGPDNVLRRKALDQISTIVPWIEANCQRERLKPGGFGMSVYEAADRGEITQDEASLLVRSMLSAGVDTTVTGIGNALWCFASNPQEFVKLREDPELAKPAFDEVLRFTSPVHSFCRTAAVDTQVAGVDIPQSAKILCVLGSANLDPLKWLNADRFDINRKPVGHLAFGVGVHGCVGQMVARAEAQAVLAALGEKVEAIEMTGEAVWRPNNAIHALDRLPIRLIRR